jgi:hypothetical protein
MKQILNLILLVYVIVSSINLRWIISTDRGLYTYVITNITLLLIVLFLNRKKD